MKLRNPHEFLPLDECQYIASQTCAMDVKLIQSCLPGRGVITTIINKVFKSLADEIRANKYTFEHSDTVEQLIVAGCTALNPSGPPEVARTRLQNVGGRIEVACAEPQNPPLNERPVEIVINPGNPTQATKAKSRAKRGNPPQQQL